MHFRMLAWLLPFALLSAQTPTFDVASVKTSARLVGPDDNNHVAFTAAGVTGRNVTLKRLLAEAWNLQLSQVVGPGWLDQAEFDIDARSNGAASKEQLALMLRPLLTERFRLTQHRETKELRVYELVVDKPGAKIHPMREGDAPSAAPGFHFRGNMQRFADLLALQMSIAVSDDPTRPGRAAGTPLPVLDRTQLSGNYDIPVDFRHEPDSDMFSLWQHRLGDQLGLRLESRKANIDVLVVDGAERTPTAN